jgi:hypothetical protein
LRLLFKVISWLLVVSKGQLGYQRVELDKLLTSIILVFQTRGDKAGIAYVRAIRGNLMNYLSNNPERIPGVTLRKSGLPEVLGNIAKILEKREIPTLGLRLLLTVLFSTRALIINSDPDFSSISDPLKKGASY